MSAPDQLAPYLHWTDAMWDASGLRPHISNRLARIDRALQGLSVITELLAEEFAASQTEDGQPSPGRLQVRHQEGLHAAVLQLNETAGEAIQQLRENEHNCWGLPA